MYATGRAAIDGYFAAALIGGLARAEFVDMLYSFRHLTDTRYYNRDLYGLDTMAYGLLTRLDLVDLMPCFEAAAPTFVSPRDATGEAPSDAEFDARFMGVARELGYVDGAKS